MPVKVNIIMEDKDKNKPLEAQEPEGKLTPAQIHFLRMFSFNKSDAFLDEIKEVLFNHFHKKAENEMEKLWTEGLMDQNFLDKIIGYSSMTWAEIRRHTHDNGKSKHHYIGREIEKLSQSAKSRIISLKLEEETDSIYSFAFSIILRIIGLRDGEKFHVLWYDARNEVYPSSK